MAEMLPRNICYMVPTNFTTPLIEKYIALNNQYKQTKITEVYGAMPFNITGHGRTAVGLPEVNYSGLRDHIRIVHKYGLKFNYLLNGVVPEECIHDREWIDKLRKEIITLQNMGIDSLTMTDDFLINIIRKEFPSLEVHISLIRGIDKLEEAKIYDDLGVSSITLNPHTINRNIPRIKEIIYGVDCEIRIYANISCLHNCPNRDVHYKYVSEHSRDRHISNSSMVDPFMSECAKRYRTDRKALLETPFIRPEDIIFYKEIGVPVFKLSDRKMPLKILVETAESYMSLKYVGNLFNLIFHRGVEWEAETDVGLQKKDFPVIDNKKLGDLEFFKNISTLTGEDLERFYETATKEAVTGDRFWISG